MYSTTLPVVATLLSLSSVVRAACSHDNCLRAFIQSSALAAPFCDTYAPGPTADPASLASSLIASISASGLTGTYTAATPTCTTGLPAFVSACSNSPAKISSACACLESATATSSTTASSSSATATSSCDATDYWPGWEGIEYAFVFGDSYTTTGFNETGVQPTKTNPLGNPTYPGYTAANGPNWVDFLTVKYNLSTLLTYNLAWGGATIDSDLVAPYEPTVSSVAQQVENLWFPNYASKPASAPWSSDNTLFAIFDGINDVGNSWGKGLPATTTLNAAIFAVYHGLVDELYYAGARNFAFLNVPPVDRAPLTNVQSVANQEEEKADIAAWNGLVIALAQDLKSLFPDINVFTVDSNALFTAILDNPASNPLTAGYKNTTDYCVAYENGTPTEDYFNSTCGVPVNQYFWLNSLHPTYPMQDVLAEGVAAQLVAGPNIC